MHLNDRHLPVPNWPDLVSGAPWDIDRPGNRASFIRQEKPPSFNTLNPSMVKSPTRPEPLESFHQPGGFDPLEQIESESAGRDRAVRSSNGVRTKIPHQRIERVRRIATSRPGWSGPGSASTRSIRPADTIPPVTG